MERLELVVAPVAEVGLGAKLSESTRPREVQKVEKADPDKSHSESMANQMKDVRKARLQRMVMQDPSLAKKLVAAEASPVYNAKGELIQTLGNLGV